MDVLISGLVIGSVYALVALGFTFTWMSTLTLNFAQGSLLMLGALIGLTLQQTVGLPLYATLPLTMLIVALISVAIYCGAIAPFNKGQDALNWLLATLRDDIDLHPAAQMTWGKSE